MADLTATELRNRLRYEPAIGKFFWRNTGKEAGSLRKQTGYITINIDKRWFQAHRLAWLYVHGKWPAKHIDHINGERADNRSCNLREATVSQNIANSKLSKANTVGLKGVSFDKEKKLFRSYIVKDGRQRHLGYFSQPQAAHEAYVKAANDNFGEFARRA